MFSPIFHNLSVGLCNYKCPETWTSVWTCTWPCFGCWPLSHRRVVWCGIQNTSWSDSDHSALSWNPKLGSGNTIGWSAFATAAAGNWNPLGCSTAWLLRWRQPFKQVPPRIAVLTLLELCCSCVLALCSECLSVKQTLAHASFQTAGLSLPADDWSHPAMPSNCTQWRAERFLSSFMERSSFCGNYAPNTRKPATQITFPLSSFLAYCICPSLLTCSFHPFEKHSRQPCQWQPWNWNTMFVARKNHPLDILQPILSPPWPHILWWICTPLQQALLTPFQEYGFALLGTPPWFPLSYKPLRATAACMLWWILLNTWHTHNVLLLC